MWGCHTTAKTNLKTWLNLVREDQELECGVCYSYSLVNFASHFDGVGSNPTAATKCEGSQPALRVTALTTTKQDWFSTSNLQQNHTKNRTYLQPHHTIITLKPCKPYSKYSTQTPDLCTWPPKDMLGDQRKFLCTHISLHTETLYLHTHKVHPAILTTCVGILSLLHHTLYHRYHSIS